MSAPKQFREYLWLINTIKKAHRITFAELSDKWAESDFGGGVSLSRTTFNRHRDAVLDMFDIIIECDRINGYEYYIANQEVLKENTVQNWLLTTLSVSNSLTESLSIQNRILLENIPSGGAVLQTVIKAMKDGFMISAEYRRYGVAEPKKFLMSPYCVKLFRQRWYALCRHRNGFFGVFSLDRFLRVELSEQRFEIDPDFNAAEYFSECFGIVSEVNAPAIPIIVRAFDSERYFLRDLPIHHTQREIATTDDYSDFEIVMRPTFDFSAHILSRGIMLKVIEPQWLADEIRDMHREAAEMYCEKS
ncbi:MAG: WYL domain-containing protein [Bacteroidales bacterium]|nr:WYL domain-containing protein [Bacteroidales bacterium]